MIVEEIKTKTLENHIRLERSALLRPIHEKSLTRENYIIILQKFYGFFHPLESQLDNFTELIRFLPDFSTRRKTVLIENDLATLTGNSFQYSIMCDNLPEVENLSQAFGCLYVMEGSTLGGKIIYKTVKEQLGVDYTQGGSFFYGYGTETGPKWKIFQQALIEYTSLYQTEEYVIAAANDTFVKFKEWIDSSQLSILDVTRKQ